MNGGIQTIQRTVKILYSVAGAEDGKTIQQIANDVGLKANTVYKFIRTLEAEGILARKTRPIRFSLGKTLSEIKQLDNERHLLTIAGRVLVRTQAKLPIANFVLLELYEDIGYQRLRVAACRPGYIAKQRDFKLSLYSKSSSLLFLAYADPEQRNQLYKKHPFEKNGKSIWGTVEKLEEYLERVRRKGYSMPDFFDEELAYRVSVPLFSPSKNLVAAIGAYIPQVEGKKYEKKLLQLSLFAAEEISRLMNRGKYW